MKKIEKIHLFLLTFLEEFIMVNNFDKNDQKNALNVEKSLILPTKFDIFRV